MQILRIDATQAHLESKLYVPKYSLDFIKNQVAENSDYGVLYQAQEAAGQSLLDVTYDSAVDTCESLEDADGNNLNLRLCSLAEIELADVKAPANLDKRRVWTSTPCDPDEFSPHSQVAGCPANSVKRGHVCYQTAMMLDQTDIRTPEQTCAQMSGGKWTAASMNSMEVARQAQVSCDESPASTCFIGLAHSSYYYDVSIKFYQDVIMKDDFFYTDGKTYKFRSFASSNPSLGTTIEPKLWGALQNGACDDQSGAFDDNCRVSVDTASSPMCKNKMHTKYVYDDLFTPTSAKKQNAGSLCTDHACATFELDSNECYCETLQGTDSSKDCYCPSTWDQDTECCAPCDDDMWQGCHPDGCCYNQFHAISLDNGNCNSASDHPKKSNQDTLDKIALADVQFPTPGCYTRTDNGDSSTKPSSWRHVQFNADGSTCTCYGNCKACGFGNNDGTGMDQADDCLSCQQGAVSAVYDDGTGTCANTFTPDPDLSSCGRHELGDASCPSVVCQQYANFADVHALAVAPSLHSTYSNPATCSSIQGIAVSPIPVDDDGVEHPTFTYATAQVRCASLVCPRNMFFFFH